MPRARTIHPARRIAPGERTNATVTETPVFPYTSHSEAGGPAVAVLCPWVLALPDKAAPRGAGVYGCRRLQRRILRGRMRPATFRGHLRRSGFGLSAVGLGGSVASGRPRY